MLKITKFCAFFLVFSVCLASAVSLLLFSGGDSILADANGNVNNGTVQRAKIIIDAGHGGEDGGAVGIGGVTEKNIDLAIALILGDLLSVSGCDVIYTRTEDIMLGDGSSTSKKLGDLRARLDIANSNPDALFVSVHANKFPLEYCRDMQLFYSRNNPQSKPLADAIHAIDRAYLEPDNKREVKQATSAIYLLDRAQIPAVLVECGFLSNTEEAALLSDPVYQHKVAAIIAAGIIQHLNSGDR